MVSGDTGTKGLGWCLFDCTGYGPYGSVLLFQGLFGSGVSARVKAIPTYGLIILDHFPQPFLYFVVPPLDMLV